MTSLRAILAATTLAALSSGYLRASDGPLTHKAPIVVVASANGCATCESVSPAAAPAHGYGPRERHHARRNQPTCDVYLCPGSCFGYFPTQWRKWEDLCPQTYPGVVIPDATRPGSPYPMIPPSSDKLPKANGPIPDPRLVPPMKLMDQTIPPPPAPVQGTRIK
jgi:hypothetical protein